MNKNIAFPNNQSNEKQPLPKSMIKGKINQPEITEEKLKDLTEFDRLIDKLTDKEREQFEQALRNMEIQDLARYRYLVNEEVDDYYEDIVKFFEGFGGVDITEKRTPNTNCYLGVRIRLPETVKFEQEDLDKLCDIMFRVTDDFQFSSSKEDGLVATFKLHGYYTREENVEVSEWAMQ